MKVTWNDTANSYCKRGRWWVTDYKEGVKYIIYRDGGGKLICPCGRKSDCEHRQVVREYLRKKPKPRAKRRVWTPSAYRKKQRSVLRKRSECGSEYAKQLQEGMNGQLPLVQSESPSQLNLSDPFQECEQLDIDQIEGRSNGELVHKLSNGKYVISYKGIMTLSEKHHITFDEVVHSDTRTVIAKGRCGTSERVSGKLVNGNEVTAIGLAKRNVARQLLPLIEIKAIEKRAELRLRNQEVRLTNKEVQR